VRSILDLLRRRSKPADSTTPQIRWDDLQRSGFFQWFHITETGSEGEKDGRLIRCKPGGFQDFIDLTFSVTPAGTVSRSELTMDRAWMEDLKSAPFAGDIAKSWVLELAQNDPAVKSFGEHLEQVGLNQPGVIVHVDSVRDGPPPDAATAQALDAYFGRAERATIAGRSSSLTIANTSSAASAAPDQRHCRLTWETTH